MLDKLFALIAAFSFLGLLSIVFVTKKKGSLLSCFLGLRKIFWLSLFGFLISLVFLFSRFKAQKPEVAAIHDVSSVTAPPVNYVDPPFFVSSKDKISEGEFETLVLDWFKKNYVSDELAEGN